MAENIIDKVLHLCGGGANTSSSATFRSDKKVSNLMFLLRRINMSYRTCCGIFKAIVERCRNKYGMTNYSTLCHPFEKSNKTLCHAELFDKANKRKFELSEPVPRVAASLVVETLKRVQGDISIGHTFKKALAFTLAETLIVMGIIGVVAALTIPNLNSSTADKEKVAKVMKIYSNLQDAFGRAEAVYGPVNEWFQTDTTATARATRLGERLTEFMKVSKNCSTNKTDCFKNFSTANETNVYKFISADGTSFGLYTGSENRFENRLLIYTDIDGPQKGASIQGKDIFIYDFSTEAGQLQLTHDDFSSYLTSCSGNGGSGTCTAWVIENGNLDYLKLKNGKCPNGKTLDGTTNTSCK